MNVPLEMARVETDPLASFDLDTLLEGAARLRADRVGLRDSLESIAFGEADRRARALAGFFGELGLVPGETILLAAGAPATAFIALIAGLRAGVHVALAPAGADEASAARMALLSGASAIVVASGGVEAAPVLDWLLAAAATPSVRLVCCLGVEKIDGMVVVDPAALDAGGPRNAACDASGAQIVTFENGVKPIAHRQRTIVAAALDVVARARIGMRLPLISTIQPASFAGLAAGPVASLIAGAPLHWHLPFDARRFLAMLDETAPAHLFVPAAMAMMLQRAGLLSCAKLASLLLLSRQATSDQGDAPPGGLSTGHDAPRIIDLYAVGERAAVPEMRTPEGVVRLANDPHYLDLEGSRLLAVGWSSEGDRTRLHGAAVSEV